MAVASHMGHLPHQKRARSCHEMNVDCSVFLIGILTALFHLSDLSKSQQHRPVPRSIVSCLPSVSANEYELNLKGRVVDGTGTGRTEVRPAQWQRWAAVYF